MNFKKYKSAVDIDFLINTPAVYVQNTHSSKKYSTGTYSMFTAHTDTVHILLHVCTDTCTQRYMFTEIQYRIDTDTCSHRFPIYGGFRLIASQLPSFLVLG